MASSSKSKRRCSNVTQSKHGTSSLESNRLDLIRLLAKNEQRKVFEEHFHGRTIFTPKFVHCAVTYPIKVAQRNRDILSAGYLKLEERLLHYFMSYVILLKFSNHCQISDTELQFMYAMKYNIKINWAQMIMRQMWIVQGSQSPLPYAIFITNILKHFNVSMDDETKSGSYWCFSLEREELAQARDSVLFPGIFLGFSLERDGPRLSERGVLPLDESRLREKLSPEREHRSLIDVKSRGFSPKRAYPHLSESPKS
ncbi:hypothetical protein Lal_00013462 [Lupinus albus]|nr:hypothetical protein Lal_00013462 [Lupinus albus]